MVALKVCPSIMASRVPHGNLIRERPVFILHLGLRFLVPSGPEDYLTATGRPGDCEAKTRSKETWYVFHGGGEMELGPWGW